MIESQAFTEARRWLTGQIPQMRAVMEGICYELRWTLDEIRAAGVPAGKSATALDVIGDQQLWDRELYRFVTDHSEGQRPILGPSWRMARAPVRIARGAPDLGEDTDYVLDEILRARSRTGGRP